MTIHIEIRKIEETFGKDRWEIRVGDISGSSSSWNISREDLIIDIADEIEKESKE